MTSLLQVSEKVCRPLKYHSNSFDGHIHIGDCGSTLNAGLAGIVRNLIQKSTGWTRLFKHFFLREVQG